MRSILGFKGGTLSLLTCVIASAVAVAGCGAQDEGVPAGPAPAPTTSNGADGEAPPPPPAPTRCARETGGEKGIYTNLVAVRVGTHAGYDRITFEFEAPKPNPNRAGSTGIPRYEIRTLEPPLYEDPSGLPLTVRGEAFVGVVFHGASGADFEGNPTYSGPKVVPAGFELLVEAAQSGDFEATLGWVLGLRDAACWKVRELHNPARVAIDIPHGA